jgi:hypothetical protein
MEAGGDCVEERVMKLADRFVAEDWERVNEKLPEAFELYKSLLSEVLERGAERRSMLDVLIHADSVLEEKSAISLWDRLLGFTDETVPPASSPCPKPDPGPPAASWDKLSRVDYSPWINNPRAPSSSVIQKAKLRYALKTAKGASPPPLPPSLSLSLS